MWGVDGACAFLAEDAGADQVTAMDRWPPSERYESEHVQRGSRVRFVQTNLYEDAAIAEIGRHDVVWCSGLLYHTPNPVLALRQLLRLTGETLIVGSKVVPAVPGLPGMAVYYPGLSARDRTTYAPVAPPVAKEPYDPERYFANWYWGHSIP